MTLELVTIPCLKDNYAYLLHDAALDETTLIDAPEAGPILAALKARGWHLDQILLTHHHWDHIDGVGEIVEATSAAILGAAADAHRLPPLTRALVEADQVKIGSDTAYVIDVPGHTVGHIAFYLPATGLCFTADSLMAAGCGRLFEGTPQQMFDSLAKLQQLPPSTLICSGHEYTAANLAFAISVDPENPALQARIRAVNRARSGNHPTVPVALSEELATNPFLRAQDPYIRQQLGMADATDAQVFTKLRALKDNF
ncbi:hydroxyacylglutathione hydrolase [Cypionkella aquatica]|uniref:Hydroxyacylglutathione hydrolase n=1 Tax=Cypionkella aquatica TaxID=1756042 RepID=A0AA37TRX1_9RHOB|nr:hydroxyacylglutathione hydrolase [Cypionkella aquatica]GLS86407.1 hydroxyacylglutathione hydrolase [Cypionkella aquatica]